MPVLKRLQTLYAERRLAQAWKQACRHPAAENTLKLSLLREWSRQIHAHTSRLLARGKGDEARLNQSHESWVDALPRHEWQELSWPELLTRPELRTAAAEAKLPASTPPEWRVRLERGDRRWEREIWIEAVRARWQGFELRAQVPIRLVEAWNEALSKTLWPRGVVLLTEAGDPPIEGDRWNGRWLAVADPATFAGKDRLVVRGIPTEVIAS